MPNADERHKEGRKVASFSQPRGGHWRSNLWSNLARVGRFGIVGIASTLVYFILTTVLGRPPIDMGSITANVLGVIVSLLVSYFGHHRFTFGVLGQHRHYLPRVLFVIATLFLLSCAVMTIGRYVLVLDHTLVTAIIAIFFPIVSFVLNLLWTFSRKDIGK